MSLGLIQLSRNPYFEPHGLVLLQLTANCPVLRRRTPGVMTNQRSSLHGYYAACLGECLSLMRLMWPEENSGSLFGHMRHINHRGASTPSCRKNFQHSAPTADPPRKERLLCYLRCLLQKKGIPIALFPHRSPQRTRRTESTRSAASASSCKKNIRLPVLAADLCPQKETSPFPPLPPVQEDKIRACRP